MAWPSPRPGLVIRYSYLWAREHARGQEEGVKDRPCAIILVTALEDGDEVVTVLPITHSPPHDPALAIEIPQSTKVRLGLDAERSWVVLSEINRFVWPGPTFGRGSRASWTAWSMESCPIASSRRSGAASSTVFASSAPPVFTARRDRPQQAQ